MEPNQAKVTFLIGPDKEAIESFSYGRKRNIEYTLWFDKGHFTDPYKLKFCTDCLGFDSWKDDLGVTHSRVIVFYYPEAGLSPKEQLDWGEMLAKYIRIESDQGCRLHVVTHSQNIILRIRTLIQQGIPCHPKASDYLIKYFSQGTITDIFIDNQGALNPGLPMSWFGADLIEVLEW